MNNHMHRLTVCAMTLSVLCGASVLAQPTCPMVQCEDGTYEGRHAFEGIYRNGFETSMFRADASLCEWWVSGKLGNLQNELTRRWPYGLATVRVRFEGELTPPGCYGHLGVARRELKVSKVSSFEIISVIPIPTLEPHE